MTSMRKSGWISPEAALIVLGDIEQDFGRSTAIKAAILWEWDSDQPLVGEAGQSIRALMAEYEIGGGNEPTVPVLVKALRMMGYSPKYACRRAGCPRGSNGAAACRRQQRKRK